MLVATAIVAAQLKRKPVGWTYRVRMAEHLSTRVAVMWLAACWGCDAQSSRSDGPSASHVYAVIDTLPDLSLGSANATGPQRFAGIQGIHVDTEGRLWVADGESRELRIFFEDGSHWKTLGGPGEGPGEFVRLRLLGGIEGDTVLASDLGTGRVTIFDPDGEFVSSERVLPDDDSTPRWTSVFDDGSLLGQVPRILSASSLEPGAVLGDSVQLIQVERDGSVVHRYPAQSGGQWLWTGRNQVPVPFTASAAFVTVGGTVHLVSGPEFQVRVLRDGAEAEGYGVDRPRRRVNEGDLRSFHAFVEEFVPEASREDYLSALEIDSRPAELPAYDRLLVSRGGQVWAQIYEPNPGAPHHWDVFDAQQSFVGQVRVPVRLYPMVVLEDALVGVWRDERGVEHVRRYSLIPAEST